MDYDDSAVIGAIRIRLHNCSYGCRLVLQSMLGRVAIGVAAHKVLTTNSTVLASGRSFIVIVFFIWVTCTSCVVDCSIQICKFDSFSVLNRLWSQTQFGTLTQHCSTLPLYVY